ncbi:zinc finger protein 57 homolog [Acomys russatus]|uniref:zinc finger protein 57 homolog n=1 Tax=Acomys russatus TaxID=60746 RepID=UPI0021E2C802|nr:zinc finger protein 57 homolog [Acomys russatus]
MAAERKPFQMPVTYEDVAVNFTLEEWECLSPNQKSLYQKVMEETFKNLTFVDCNTVKKGQEHRMSGLYLPKTRGGKKSRKRSPSVKDEDSAKEPSPPCAGVFQGGPLLFCLTCGKCFTKNIHLLHHQFSLLSQKTTSRKGPGCKRRGERPYFCNLCGKTYCDASGLSRHRRVHLGYRPRPCPVCGKGFRDQSEVKRHLKVHQKKKPVAGNQARTVPPAAPGSGAPTLRLVKVIQGPVARAKARNSKASSSQDARTNAVPGRRSIEKASCPYCHTSFVTKTSFLTHLKSHLQNQPSQSTCSEESSQSPSTSRKQAIYCCPICDICFNGKGRLLDHLCEKRLGRFGKCWETLGHLLGFLHDPVVQGQTSQVKQSSRGRGGGRKSGKDEDKKTYR